MAIEWDVLIIEMAFLGAIIFGSTFLGQRMQERSAKREEHESRKRIIIFLIADLEKKLRFIDESIRYHDFKPFFTDVWDAVQLTGKQALLSFKIFEDLQHAYSWMKYYNNEIEQNGISDEKTVLEILEEVKKSINQILKTLQTSTNTKSI